MEKITINNFEFEITFFDNRAEFKGGEFTGINELQLDTDFKRIVTYTCKKETSEEFDETAFKLFEQITTKLKQRKKSK